MPVAGQAPLGNLIEFDIGVGPEQTESLTVMFCKGCDKLTAAKESGLCSTCGPYLIREEEDPFDE